MDQKKKKKKHEKKQKNQEGSCLIREKIITLYCRQCHRKNCPFLYSFPHHLNRLNKEPGFQPLSDCSKSPVSTQWWGPGASPGTGPSLEAMWEACTSSLLGRDEAVSKEAQGTLSMSQEVHGSVRLCGGQHWQRPSRS